MTSPAQRFNVVAILYANALPSLCSANARAAANFTRQKYFSMFCRGKFCVPLFVCALARRSRYLLSQGEAATWKSTH